MKELTAFAYLFASVLFIVGLKMLSSARTARRGNIMGALGMLLAIVVTLLQKEIIDFTLVIAGLLIGSAIGLYLARTVQMTAMPQMVGVLNGFGGGASALVAYAEYIRLGELGTSASVDVADYDSAELVDRLCHHRRKHDRCGQSSRES